MRTGRYFFLLQIVPALWFAPAIVSAIETSTVTQLTTQRGIIRVATLPSKTVELPTVTTKGRTQWIKAGDDLQAALNAAQPGDTLALQAGASFVGPFVLPHKNGTDWITIRSSVTESASQKLPVIACQHKTVGTPLLPPRGCRVSPADAKLMPRLISRYQPAITAASGAHHYRFVGIEIAPASAEEMSDWHQPLQSARNWLRERDKKEQSPLVGLNLVVLGFNETDRKAQPHHFVFERCYLHGDSIEGARRGIALNSQHTAVIDSYLSDFKERDADSQAIAGWNGAGPFLIANNYLEAAGENLMFGGADPQIAALVPTDIVIRNNHFAKPLSWKAGHATYAGTQWQIKNLFELKNARRVLVEGNLFEYNWPQAQDGFSILFTVRNQNGKAPWSVVQDVTFRNNVVRHVANGINMLGQDDNYPSRQTRRITIRNNVFDDVGGHWAGGRLFQLNDAVADVVIQHNTAMHTESTVVAGDRQAHPGFVFTDNIVLHNQYGVIGSGADVGASSLQRYFPAAVLQRNVFVGGPAHRYPNNNHFPASLDEVGFHNHQRGDFRLRSVSPYRKAAIDGADIGVDWHALCAALPKTGQISACDTAGAR